MNQERPYADYILDHQKRVALFRGHVINNIGFIEAQLETFIATYFCHERLDKLIFIECLLHNKDTTFSTKINLFEKILKLKYPKEFDKTIIKAIQNKKDLRNKMAHYMIRSVKENIGTDALYFTTLEGHKLKKVTYDRDDANKLINGIYDLFVDLRNYIKKLEGSATL